MNKYFLSILGTYVDTYYDVDTFPKEGDFCLAEYVQQSLGGTSSNVACVAASKDVDTYALDMLGENDDTTPFILSELKRMNVITDFVSVEKNVTNGKVLLITSNSERTMFLINPKRPPYVMNKKMTDLLNNAPYIYTLMHMVVRSFENIEPLLEAKRHGAKVIFDGSDKYENKEELKQFYQLCDGLFINEINYERLLKASDDDPKKIIFENGGEFVCLTKGSKGSTLYLKDREISVPIVPNVKVIDSTGAGDAFAGCFLACLIKGFTYEKALRYASANGAYACTVMGGTGGVCSMEDLEKFAKEHNYDL